MFDRITLKLLFFAKSRELAGLDETTIEIESTQIQCSELLNKICNLYGLNVIKTSVILAINGEYCDNLSETIQLKSGDEIAVIPPISGG